MSDIIFIRCDSNTHVSTGHVMRCLSIALEIISLGYLIEFIVADEVSEEFLLSKIGDNKRMSITVTNTSYDKLEDEIEVISGLIRDRRPMAILIDTYYVTSRYLDEINELCKVYYIDDLVAFDYPVYSVINYNISIEKKAYNYAKKLLLGGKYTPLRKQFSEVDFVVRKEVKDILITTGGTDYYHITKNIINQGNSIFGTNINLHIIVGNWNEDREEIKSLAADNSRINLYENVSDMADIMAKCDIAITACGTTLCELCAVGIPTIAFSIADNQKPQANSFNDEGVIDYIGDIRSETDFYRKLERSLSDMISNYNVRENYSARMKATIDGLGSNRIASEITS